MKPYVVFTGEYKPRMENELLKILEAGSSNSQFNDKSWLFDKLQRSAGHYLRGDYSVYFNGIPEKYMNYVKFWVLVRLKNNKKLSTVSANINSLKHFFQFLETECDSIPLKYIKKLILERFYEYLKELSMAQGSKESAWGSVAMFFREMEDWPRMPSCRVVPPGNPFNRNELQRLRASRKSIPEVVVKKLDQVFKNQRIPLPIRLIYWLLRSIPSRVQEITSVPIECLMPYLGNWVIRLHNWKQSGSQLEPNIRLVHIQNIGHGAFLIKLIKEQQKYAISVQRLLPEKMRGYLFVYHPFKIKMKSFGIKKQQYEKEPIFSFNQKKALKILNGQSVRKYFKKIARSYCVLGIDGKLYNLITHILRHKAITDRYHAGFKPMEIRAMTQQSTQTIGYYIHQSDDQLKIAAQNKRKHKRKGPPVVFKGRILNMTREMEERLLKRPRAFRIGNLGICSDMTSCTNDLFECLSCPFLVPDFVYNDYYREQEQLWKKKAEISFASGNTQLGEQAHYVATCFSDILLKVKMGIFSNEGQDNEQ